MQLSARLSPQAKILIESLADIEVAIPGIAELAPDADVRRIQYAVAAIGGVTNVISGANLMLFKMDARKISDFADLDGILNVDVAQTYTTV